MAVLDNAFLFGHLVERATGEHAAAIEAMQQTHALLVRGRLFQATVPPTGEGMSVGVRL